MENLQVLPQTQTDLTNTDIAYSVKIAEQTIESKLLERQTQLDKELRDLEESMDKLLNRESISQLLEDTFELTVDNCSSLQILINAYNLMNPDSELHSNMDIVTYFDKGEWVRFFRSSYTINLNRTAELVKEGAEMKVSFSTGLAILTQEEMVQVREGEEREADLFCSEMTIDMEVPYGIQNILEEKIVLLERKKAIEEENGLINKKKDNMQSTLKDVESKLLIRALSQSEKGKEVLSVTADIINSVVGSEVNLLN